MGKHVVCAIDELPPSHRKIVEIEGRSIGVFNVKGRLYALRNRCPHRGAPLCEGLLKGLVIGPQPYCYEVTRGEEILRCPWHGWEFDITSGRSIFNPHRVRVKSYDVTVESADADTSIETFPVSVESDLIVIHIDS